MTAFTRFGTTLALLAAAACASVPPPPAAPPAPTYEQKLAWIVRLEDQRVLRDPAPAPPPPAPQTGRGPRVTPGPPPDVPDLTVLLSDADARLRRRAALAVGRVGLADGAAPLLPLVRDPDPDVRQMACFALGLLRSSQAVDALLAALDDVDVQVQGRAAEALGTIGEARAATAVGAMVARYADDPAVTALAADDLRADVPPAAEAFRLGLYALVRLKAWDPMAAAVLGPGGAPKVRWWPVAYAVQRIEDPRAIPTLVTLARSSGVDVLGFAARGLGVLKAAPGVPVLVPLLDPDRHDQRVVASAARALGQIGRADAAEPLRRLLRHPKLEIGTRLEVIVALGLVKAVAATDDLLDLVGHPDPSIRGAALVGVAALDQETFTTMMSGLDPDPAWPVRVDLTRALASVTRERALPRLEELARDPDLRVVAAALRVLGELNAPGLADLLKTSLAAEDLSLRATAAQVTGSRRPAGGDAWLRTAWERGRSDASYVARAAALSALAAYGSLARPTLEEALGDPDWAVRVRAAELLRTLEPGADVSRMRPAPTRRAAESYATTDLVAPPFTPQVYLDTAKGTVQIELHVLDAPLTVANFVELARKGFFANNPIHRVVPNFVVQDGDPRGDGEGGPGYSIRDELNTRPYLRGTVGMALDWADTGGSQFFITHGPQPHLDGRYTVFGTVVNGMDVVDRLQRWDVIQRVRVWDGVQPPGEE